MQLTRIHPVTGEVLEPIYVTKRGVVVWPQLGASPDDDSNSGDGGSDGDGDDDGEGGAGGDGGTDDGGDGGKDDDKVSKSDLEAVIRRMKAADQRAAKAEAELKKIEDGKKDELTKATERAEAAEAKVKELAERLTVADLRDAFGQVDGVSFKKPATALKIARAEGYLDDCIDGDGKVDTKAVAKKAKEFAEAYPELLAGKEDDGTPPPSGTPAGSGRKKSGSVDDGKIKDRYGHLLR